MLEQIYSDVMTIKKHRTTIFGPYIDSFVAARCEQQYAVSTIRANVAYIGKFAEFLCATSKSSIRDIKPDDLDRYIESYLSLPRTTVKSAYSPYGSVTAILEHLRKANVIEAIPEAEKSEDRWTKLLNTYLSFLEHDRGLSASTRGTRARWGRALFDHLNEELGDAPLEDLTIGMIDALVMARASSMNRERQHEMVQSVRCVLRYLWQEGNIGFDLASLVWAPRRYKGTALPSGLEEDQVTRVLDAVDRTTPIGLRDYAMLSLLAVYGMRSSEVVSLSLDQVDWKADQLHIIQGKSSRELLLPLVEEVGDGILAYLREGRPLTKHREIFVRHKVPYRPLGTAGLYHAVRRAFARAGVELDRGGAHLFRHAAATWWLRAGCSLKAIGDLLGHRCADTTRIYAKLAIEQLREVALAAPEMT